MAYCAKCGAYIPDNFTECVACGYNAEAEAAYQKQESVDRAAAEERRRKQQEADRRWAEAEKLRRERENDERAKWDEAERIRRRREEEAKARWEAEKARRAAFEQGKSTQTINIPPKFRTARESKFMSVIAYLGILFLVPMFFAKDDDTASFHARQGMRLFLFNAITDFIAAIAPIAGILKLASLYFIIKGIDNAANNRKIPLPYIGDIQL